jgi:hypothetical protein
MPTLGWRQSAEAKKYSAEEAKTNMHDLKRAPLRVEHLQAVLG